MVHLRTPLCSPAVALRRLRGWDDVDTEIEEIQQEDEAERAAGFISVVKLFRMRALRWQVISVIVLMAGQQLSGVNAVGHSPGPGTEGSVQAAADPTSLWVCLPDLLLRRPDLPECRCQYQRCPVRDGGHGNCQCGDNLRGCECPGELSPICYQGGRAS